MAKVIVVIGFALGDECILAASIEAWKKHLSKCELMVVGDECELPKGVGFIGCPSIAGRTDKSRKIVAAAEALEAESFVFANNTYPLQKIDLSDIDQLFANPAPGNDAYPIDFATELPRIYEKALVLQLKNDFDIVNVPFNFESKYFNHYSKEKPTVILRDLADKIRLQVYDSRPDEYRTAHLLKHKKFVVVNKHGQKALKDFFH
ncbi:MAG: hypothetical protein WCX31_04605 [Salinivirgaceae bacterium]|jgi:hypothetical protein